MAGGGQSSCLSMIQICSRSLRWVSKPHSWHLCWPPERCRPSTEPAAVTPDLHMFYSYIRSGVKSCYSAAAQSYSELMTLFVPLKVWSKFLRASRRSTNTHVLPLLLWIFPLSFVSSAVNPGQDKILRDRGTQFPEWIVCLKSITA